MFWRRLLTIPSTRVDGSWAGLLLALYECETVSTFGFGESPPLSPLLALGPPIGAFCLS